MYEVEEVPLRIRGETVVQAHLRYVEESEYTGKDLLTGKADTPEAVRAAVEFLEAELADGPKPSAGIRKTAEELGISKYALVAARKRLGILARKSDFDGAWELDLPVRITVRKRDPEGDGPSYSSAQITR